MGKENHSTGSFGGHVEHLNTHNFESSINAFKEGVIEYDRITTGVMQTTNNLMSNWKGEGKTQFEKDYNVIYLCLKDISEIMYELRDALITAEAEYIKSDEAYAKEITQ